jgi:hypothetical protein
MKEIVEDYNELVTNYDLSVQIPVNKFSTKAIGMKRLQTLIKEVEIIEEAQAIRELEHAKRMKEQEKLEEITPIVINNTNSVNLIQFPNTKPQENGSPLSAVLTPLEEAGVLYPTSFAELSLPNGDIVPDRRAIINSEDGSYVSTVGNAYNLINNREVFTNFANTLINSEIDTTDMKVAVSTSRSKVYARFTFPKHKVEIDTGIGKSDDTELMITARNSYDGTSKFMVEIGGFRLVCSNGQGIGQYTNVYSNRHTVKFAEKDMSDYLNTATTVFAEAGEEWQNMTKVEVLDNEAFEVVQIMTEVKTKSTLDEIMDGKKGRLKSAMEEWFRYKNELGSNKFALFNTVTHLSTHISSERGDIVALRIHKEKMRDKALNSPKFSNLHTLQVA